MLGAMTINDAVNIMLSSIGADPVNSIDTEFDVDTANAVRILDKVSRSVQRRGWSFNKQVMTLRPDLNSKRILWDKTIVSHKSTDGNMYVKRGDYVMNLTDNSFTFESPIELEVVLAVDFEDLPDVFRDYVTAKASVEFQTKYMGDQAISQDLYMELQSAERGLTEYDIDNTDFNMLEMSGVSRTLARW